MKTVQKRTIPSWGAPLHALTLHGHADRPERRVAHHRQPHVAPAHPDPGSVPQQRHCLLELLAYLYYSIINFQ